MRFKLSRSQVRWVVAMCAVLLSWESAHGGAVRAQELVVGPGETRKLPAGRHTFESVELADGAAIELADGHTVIETASLSTAGTSSIRSDKSHDLLQLPRVGGAGGAPFTMICGADRVLVGVDVRAGGYVDALALVCVEVSQDGSWAAELQRSNFVGGEGGSLRSLVCPRDHAVAVISGRSGAYLDNLRLGCRRLAKRRVLQGEVTWLDSAGGRGGRAFGPFDCPDGRPAVGFRGRSGGYVDAIQMSCRFLENALELIVLDTADMAGALVIDGSGIAGQAGAHNGGGVGGAGLRGEDGMTVDVTLVHRAGMVDFIERFIDGRRVAEGRLKVISRGGGGGRGGNGEGGTESWSERVGGQRGPGATIHHKGTPGHAGGNGGDGGNGGAVSVRYVMLPGAESAGADLFGLNEAESSEPGRRRRIDGKDFPAVSALYGEGLGLEVDLAPGSGGDPGATGRYGSARGQAGRVGNDGSVTVEALDWDEVVPLFRTTG